MHFFPVSSYLFIFKRLAFSLNLMEKLDQGCILDGTSFSFFSLFFFNYFSFIHWYNLLDFVFSFSFDNNNIKNSNTGGSFYLHSTGLLALFFFVSLSIIFFWFVVYNNWKIFIETPTILWPILCHFKNNELKFKCINIESYILVFFLYVCLLFTFCIGWKYFYFIYFVSSKFKIFIE